jgi:mannose-6-phosphate isomerase
MSSPFGEPDIGVSTLPDGRSLRDAIGADPEAFLGPRHCERFGPDVMVLIKLLDAGERLPVHLHPNDDFAQRHLASAFGKTEAWIILEAEPGAAVHAGLRQPVDLATVSEWVQSQDSEAMLSALNRVDVAAGDTVFVPAGTPHAIGEGILLAELQQPTDFSLLLEWKGFAPDEDAAFLGLGVHQALKALDLKAWSAEDLARAGSGRGPSAADLETLFPAEADPFFRAERVRSGADLAQEFAVLLVTEGRGELSGEGWNLGIAKGDAVLVPFAAGAYRVTGQVEALRCMPPAPDSGL